MTAVTTAAGAATRRRIVFVVALGLATGALIAAKLAADQLLAAGRVVDLALIQLRWTGNTGVAFSIGADLPRGIVLAIPAAITVGVVLYAWRHIPHLTGLPAAALTAVAAGALANVLDRAGDGVVTDYLHTGWWPTFNLPDVFIVGGAAVLVLASIRRTRDDHGPES